MKPYEYYKDAGEYPATPKRPLLPPGANKAMIIAYADEIEAYDAAMVEYQKARKAYDNKQGELEQEFKKDLLEKFGLTNHPKADKIYAYVWDQGHAYGFSEVHNVLSNMADLFE